MITAYDLKESLPKQHRSHITDDLVTKLVDFAGNPELGEQYLNNLVTYTSVLQEGKFKLQDYFNAVMFISHKSMGSSSLEAYQKVFPDRVKRLADKGTSTKDIHAFASCYNKTKLVTLIYEQTLIPDYIVYTGIRHKAIGRLAQLMDSQNETIAWRASDSLLRELKAPEKSSLKIDIETKDSGVIGDLASALHNLSNGQREKIIDGEFTTKEVAHSQIMMSSEDE